MGLVYAVEIATIRESARGRVGGGRGTSSGQDGEGRRGGKELEALGTMARDRRSCESCRRNADIAWTIEH